MLNPRRRNMLATRVRTPGWSATMATSVWLRLGPVHRGSSITLRTPVPGTIMG